MKKDKHVTIKNMTIAFFLNFIFSIIEIIGGFYTNSIAITTDALHDLGDSLSIAITIYLEKLSKKKPNKNYTYGYIRYSIIGAIINLVILLIGSVTIIYTAIPRLFNPQEVDYNGMLFFAIIGIFVNLIGAIKTHSKNNIAEETVSLHLLEDLFGWVLVIITSLFVKFFDLYILDPILSIGLSLFIIINVFKNTKKVLDVILEKMPTNIYMDHIENKIKEINEINNIHHLHIWTLDGNVNCLTAHINVDSKLSLKEVEKIKNDVKSLLKDENIHHSTLEIETGRCDNENCNIEIDTENTIHHHHHH